MPKLDDDFYLIEETQLVVSVRVKDCSREGGLLSPGSRFLPLIADCVSGAINALPVHRDIELEVGDIGFVDE